jgi:uncharacterized protein (TIGR04255 family)
MPNSLSIDEFKGYSLTCELRYKNAYLIYDRTGQVLEDLRDSFTDIKVSSAAPAQTSFTSEEGTLVLELGACRFSTGQPDKNTESFVIHCKAFFDAVTERLNIGVFTRIGLRYILKKEFKTIEESNAALASLNLVNLRPTKRFNSSDSATEVMFRWEDTQLGALVRLKAETTDITVNIAHELRDEVPKFDKKIIGITLDIDYYTVAPVERDQWDSQQWLPQKLRLIRKEVDGILQGGGR